MRIETGHTALRAGRDLEQEVAADIIGGGGVDPNRLWGTMIGSVLDYARKTDVVAICPANEERPVQVSLHPKSRRATNGLKRLGITAITGRDLEEGVVHQQICGDCPMYEACGLRYADREPPKTA